MMVTISNPGTFIHKILITYYHPITLSWNMQYWGHGLVVKIYLCYPIGWLPYVLRYNGGSFKRMIFYQNLSSKSLRLWRQCDSKTAENFDFDGLVQDKRNSIANALEVHLSYTNLTMYSYDWPLIASSVHIEDLYFIITVPTLCW